MGEKLLPCEELVRKIIGEEWRELDKSEQNGAWGVAIVKSVLDGTKPKIDMVAKTLGVGVETLQDAFVNLSDNRAFSRRGIESDRKLLEDGDIYTWSYYAAYASGHTGVNSDPKEVKSTS